MNLRQRLLALEFPEIRQSFSGRDTILYALGVGLGCDPVDPEQLRYVYEEGLAALPSMAVTLAYPGYWYRDLDTGLDHMRTVHASETFVIHKPLPIRGTVVAKPRVIEVIDKGRERGALVVSERDIRDVADGSLLATVRQTATCRGDGGFSEAPETSDRAPSPPDRDARHRADLADDAADRADLSPQRRLQSTACGTRICARCRISAPDPAWAGDDGACLPRRRPIGIRQRVGTPANDELSFHGLCLSWRQHCRGVLADRRGLDLSRQCRRDGGGVRHRRGRIGLTEQD